MSARIFISHSTRGTGDKRFLEDLRNRLESVREDGEALFDVVVDISHLKAGDYWRPKLLNFLDSCCAGIVLLNREAIEDSDWVHAEASILRWRKWRKEQVCLILILVGNGTLQAFDNQGKWKPLAFNELQFLSRAREFTGPYIDEEGFEDLLKALRPVTALCQETKYEKLRTAVITQLTAFLEGNMSGPEIRKEAELLLEQGLKRIPPLVENHGLGRPTESLENVIELVAPWWINPVSSCRLACPEEASRPAIFNLNGSDLDYTPLMYVQNACCLGPDLSWKVIQLLAEGLPCQEDLLLEEAVDRVRKGLKHAYRKVWRRRSAQQIDDGQLNRLIEGSRRHQRPTFVAMPASLGADGKIPNAIFAAFPKVDLLLMANTPEEVMAIEYGEPLLPLPDPQTEETEYDNYLTARSTL